MSIVQERPESQQLGSAEIRWRSWPLRQRPLIAMLAALGLAAIGALIDFVFASQAIVLVAMIALGLAGWRLFVPIDFTVDEGGVKQQWLRRRRYDDWNTFRAFSSLAHGCILWPNENCCPLDAARGLFLPYSRQEAGLVVLLRRHLVELP
jgi:hypothetical protein